jgi:hypothetical protein
MKVTTGPGITAEQLSFGDILGHRCKGHQEN